MGTATLQSEVDQNRRPCRAVLWLLVHAALRILRTT
jgi:hypothetical protein